MIWLQDTICSAVFLCMVPTVLDSAQLILVLSGCFSTADSISSISSVVADVAKGCAAMLNALTVHKVTHKQQSRRLCL